MLPKYIRDNVPQPGNDPVERLKHVNVIHQGDPDASPNDHAITATHSLYAAGVWTGLTYGDLRKLENRITLGVTAERVKIVDYVRGLAREMEGLTGTDRGVRIAMAALYQDLADKINSYQDAQKVSTWGPGTNTGHGHVYPRPDGVTARCMGPGGCLVCSDDKINLLNSQKLSAS